MTVTHHPTEATLAAFAAGTLDEGRMLVVAAHLAACPECRRTVRMLEATGGVLLDDLPPVDVGSDALARAMAEIDGGGRDAGLSARPGRGGEVIPGLSPAHQTLLASYEMGPWRWVGPGVSWRQIETPTLPGGRVFLLKAAGGTALPDHTHTGTELTCVLTGAFRHEHGRYGPGDVDEADDEVDHTPIVEPGGECICLVAMQGRLKLNGLLGKVLQPFVRL
ncbi:ChrR family anti-sigma-E factor [Rhodoplanes sp. TEM]|uniref:ChrR family anti-sigma-E factor n=1 Tax=Rhodoplanes tepidamans TaxID=200616 RepID=A0ABT5JFW5_RHOTP|nr:MULTISPECIES: ChrR family anti-sigma-E factor [Rhodoplanes]MDC7788595.1 ChrR family anti-sigma-E factor [Rhodoplanes tepidamans]MDC7986851.1 ChrR family anti-sigma-E factor [Rhodoplanes sp. TEM]MDQ0358578.1 putative transcriptional regulator [Rhodoplanes tepidamans]